MKLKRVVTRDGQPYGWRHWCPGCRCSHTIAVERITNSGDRWTFDLNLDAPTFAPSINRRVGPYPTVPAGRPDAGKIDVCHYFLKAGVIEFLGDCTHHLSGQRVPLPDLPGVAA